MQANKGRCFILPFHIEGKVGMKTWFAQQMLHLPFHTQNKKKFKDQEISKHAKKTADETPGKNGRLNVFYSLPRTPLDTNEI